jgi:hypothetical protein
MASLGHGQLRLVVEDGIATTGESRVGTRRRSPADELPAHPCNEVVTTSPHRPAGAAIEGRAIMTVDKDDADVAPHPTDMPTLPPGLLERGVVVLQDWVWEIRSGDGRDISRDVNNRFSNHIKNAYDICWKGWQYFEANDYPDGQLDWNDKIGEITSVALYQAALVTVRVRNWGDGTRRRHRKLEQQLIHLLTQNNISVSLIAAKTPTIGRAVVLPARQPPVTCENVDLAPYLGLWPQWCATVLGRPPSTLSGRLGVMCEHSA